MCARNNSLLQSFEWNFASHKNTNKWVFAKDALNVNNKSPKWNNNMLSEQTLRKHWKIRLVAVAVVVVVHFSCNARNLVPPKSHTFCPRFVYSLFISRCSQSQVILKHWETFFVRIAQCTFFPIPSLVDSILKMRRWNCVRFVFVFFLFVFHYCAWKNECEFFCAGYSFTGFIFDDSVCIVVTDMRILAALPLTSQSIKCVFFSVAYWKQDDVFVG